MKLKLRSSVLVQFKIYMLVLRRSKSTLIFDSENLFIFPSLLEILDEISDV